MSDIVLLSSLWLLPVIGLIVVLAIPKRNEASIKWISLAFMIATFLVTLVMLGNYVAVDDQGNHGKAWKSLADRAKNNTVKVTNQAIDRAEAAGGQIDPTRPLSSIVDQQVVGEETAEGQNDLVARLPWIPSFNIQYYVGVDGISLSLVVLTGLVSVLACLASWNIDQAGQGLLRPVHAPGRQHDGGVHLAGYVPVLRLLRGDAAADVLPDRHLGRSEARVRGDQVPALHPVRVGLHPAGGPDPLLLPGRRGGRRVLGALVRRGPAHADRQQDELFRPQHPVVCVHPLLHRVLRQAAVIPVPHLAA